MQYGCNGQWIRGKQLNRIDLLTKTGGKKSLLNSYWNDSLSERDTVLCTQLNSSYNEVFLKFPGYPESSHKNWNKAFF